MRSYLPMSAVDTNDAMGPLAGVARHIAAGLQDSATRMAIARVLKTTGESRIGLDLQSCDQGEVSRLLVAGERAGAGAADSVCRKLQALSGLVLYMDPDRLRAWDGSVIPVVTAVARLDTNLAASFHGYLTSIRIVELSRDRPPAGPLLVVLPYRHPRRVPGRTTQAPLLRTDYPPPPPPGLIPR